MPHAPRWRLSALPGCNIENRIADHSISHHHLILNHKQQAHGFHFSQSLSWLCRNRRRDIKCVLSETRFDEVLTFLHFGKKTLFSARVLSCHLNESLFPLCRIRRGATSSALYQDPGMIHFKHLLDI